LLWIATGLAANETSPRGITLLEGIAPAAPIPTTSEFIPLAQAKRLRLGGTALFLDAREPDDFAAGRIGNALNLPAQSFTLHFPEVAPVLSPDSELVLYCDGQECDPGRHLAASLRQQGFTNLHVLANGWTAWHEAGLPTTIGGQK
jgi:rhodanese-related sulfurtransferase